MSDFRTLTVVPNPDKLIDANVKGAAIPANDKVTVNLDLVTEMSEWVRGGIRHTSIFGPNYDDGSWNVRETIDEILKGAGKCSP